MEGPISRDVGTEMAGQPSEQLLTLVTERLWSACSIEGQVLRHGMSMAAQLSGRSQ
jgi:hypothetical protein